MKYSDGSYSWDIPFTDGKKWIEFEIHEGVYLEFQIKEIYNVLPQHQSVLGKTDARTIFDIGFRIPFRSEKA